jgi:ribosomal protein S27AE
MPDEDINCGRGRPPQVRTCPNCNEETLRLHRQEQRWVCDDKNCGYSETSKDYEA